MRNRKSGETSTACSAKPTDSSNVSPFLRARSNTSTKRFVSAGVTGRRNARRANDDTIFVGHVAMCVFAFSPT